MIKEWFSVFTGEKIKDHERKRALICDTCKHKTFSTYLDKIKGEIEEVQGHYCNDCYCPLIAKIKTTNKKHICKHWKN